jgi:predicted phosphate transport protein (TIGR00153 family)
MKTKPDKIMSLMLDLAQNMKECGEYFSKFSIESPSDLKVFSEKVKDFESNGDTILHEINVELNRAFITSIDPEDILTLAEKMDDVVDCIEEAAAYFYMYRLTDIDDYMSEFRTHIGTCTGELYFAIDFLVKKQLKSIREHTIHVKTNEEECDTLERKAIRSLFKKYTDPIKIIQYKDLYEVLENTVDACQIVAKVLDIVIMKNM